MRPPLRSVPVPSDYSWVAAPRRRSAKPSPSRTRAATTASHTGKPVNGRVEPATWVTVPSTPWCAGACCGFSVVVAPSTPPAALVGDGFAVDAAAVPAVLETLVPFVADVELELDPFDDCEVEDDVFEDDVLDDCVEDEVLTDVFDDVLAVDEVDCWLDEPHTCVVPGWTLELVVELMCLLCTRPLP